MKYRNMEDCINDLEQHGHLIRVKEEVDPHLEMAAIHMKVHEAKGPALLFENVKAQSSRPYRICSARWNEASLCSAVRWKAYNGSWQFVTIP